MLIPQELYTKIIEVMPIPCVDLLVCEPSGKVLMMKRKNQPAKGSWWFPGGRILFGEHRKDAASRKLMQECGLSSFSISEIGTYDVILDMPENKLSHGITTVYKILVDTDIVSMDKQNSEYDWKHPQEWLNKTNNSFIKSVLESCSK